MMEVLKQQQQQNNEQNFTQPPPPADDECLDEEPPSKVSSSSLTRSPRCEAFLMTGDKMLNLNPKISPCYAKVCAKQSIIKL
jgi:hypothetical protein